MKETKKTFIKNIGFTLAEVLVTLSIIGVISAMVIPSLQKTFQETQYRAGAKNAYSTLSQALTMMEADNDFPTFGADHTNFRTKFCNQLSCIKTGTLKDIFPDYYNFYKSSTGYDYSWRTDPAAILKNGMLAYFDYSPENCAGTAGTAFTTVCGFIGIDTNGNSGPNMIGKDLISFWIVKERGTYILYPHGIQNDWRGCNNNAATMNQSTGCTAYYLDGRELP